MTFFLSILIGYGLGGLPFAYWLGKLRDVSLTEIGTGNPGAANLFRFAGPDLGVLGAALDIGKGAAAVAVARALGLTASEGVAAGAAAVIGHWHSPFLGFGGGIGLAAAIGTGVGALPVAAGAGLGAGIVATLISRNVGPSAGLGWIVFLAVAIARGDPWPAIVGVVALGAAVMVRGRLLGRPKEEEAG